MDAFSIGKWRMKTAYNIVVRGMEKMKPNLLILGGDQRNRIVLDILRERGFSVEYFSDTRRENTQAVLQHISQTEYQLLPMMLAEQPICGIGPYGAFRGLPATQPFVLWCGYRALDKGLPG